MNRFIFKDSKISDYVVNIRLEASGNVPIFDVEYEAIPFPLLNQILIFIFLSNV